jgi:hypothetical protein
MFRSTSSTRKIERVYSQDKVIYDKELRSSSSGDFSRPFFNAKHDEIIDEPKTDKLKTEDEIIDVGTPDLRFSAS